MEDFKFTHCSMSVQLTSFIILSLYVGGQEHTVGKLNPITSQTDFSREVAEKPSGETKSGE